MISAPIIPRTRESLWDLLEDEPERIERGFELVQRELVTSEGTVVDALARDTTGRLGLVFLAVDDEEDEQPQDVALRVYASVQWVGRNERLLLSALADSGVRAGVTPRVVVLGFEFSESMVAALRDLPIEDLALYRCEAFVLNGHLHAGMSPVLGRQAEGEHDTLAVPPGVADDELRLVGEQIVDLVRRIDPNVQVQGDRFSRRFVSKHGVLAELFLVGDRLFISGVSDDDRPQPISGADSREIADAIVRNYLGKLSRPDLTARRETALRDVMQERSSPRAPVSGRSASDADPRPKSARDRLRIDHALHPVPRGPLVDDTEVSQEEFDAFSGLSSESNES